MELQKKDKVIKHVNNSGDNKMGIKKDCGQITLSPWDIPQQLQVILSPEEMKDRTRLMESLRRVYPSAKQNSNNDDVLKGNIPFSLPPRLRKNGANVFYNINAISKTPGLNDYFKVTNKIESKELLANPTVPVDVETLLLIKQPPANNNQTKTLPQTNNTGTPKLNNNNKTTKSVYNVFKEDPNTQYSINHVTKERFEILKVKAMEALNEGKTFTVSSNSNGSSAVRRALLKRGWVERYATWEDKGTIHERFIQAPDKEHALMSRFLRSKPVRLLWSDGRVNWSMMHPSILVNRFPSIGKSLSSKSGLSKYLHAQAWTYEEGLSNVKFPRTFSIVDPVDLKYFASQFRITACVNMLKRFCSNMLEKPETVISENGTINVKILDFAIERVCEYLNIFDHADVDHWNYAIVSDLDWERFLTEYYEFAHSKKTFKNTEHYEVDKLITSAEVCLDKIRNKWTQLDFEGEENVWIVKPEAQSCGRGIVIKKNLSEIIEHCSKKQVTIIQKYIEKPLLIYNTKFDIRQWFLVTSSTPLKIYMYRKCYLRFCSKEFSLENLHMSIHLSNNSIQWRYENMKKNNPKLPRQNMWDSEQFKDYLKCIGKLDKWYSVVMKGIREGIVGAMLACQESLCSRRNSFNLYGADFLLTEDLTPLLIEINSCPCMRHTTDVTSKMCPSVLDDTIEVVTSKKPVHNAGLFQLIFNQQVAPQRPFAIMKECKELTLIGKKARIHLFSNDRCKQMVTPPLIAYNRKHSHFEDRTIKFEDLAWYNTRKPVISIVATLHPKYAYSLPKYPGDVTATEEICYATRQLDPSKATKWMECCKSWISRHLETKKCCKVTGGTHK